MALTNERINEVLTKNIQTKTMLVSVFDLEKITKQYLDDGWKLVNKVQVNERYKVTFQKVSKA